MEHPNSHGRSLLGVFPATAGIAANGHLTIGGCDSAELVARFGSPLYVFDESTLRLQCSGFKREFGRRYPNSLVIYASKAFTNMALVSLIASEELGLDVVSGGELAVASAVGFPPDRIYFHGNNKSRSQDRKSVV